ncbi:hypothetical protein SAMN02910317_03120 [Ruminococcaceae bacterium FB2012]|nr:hypothetical protein SAMN02910317_03120 [Ruminococcaceae bacterium FB2012]
MPIMAYVVCKSQQKELSSDVVFAPAQESSEAMILFKNAEYAFSLYASVHSELSSECAIWERLSIPQ